jgi:hypothetical protein
MMNPADPYNVYGSRPSKQESPGSNFYIPRVHPVGQNKKSAEVDIQLDAPQKSMRTMSIVALVFALFPTFLNAVERVMNIFYTLINKGIDGSGNLSYFVISPSWSLIMTCCSATGLILSIIVLRRKQSKKSNARMFAFAALLFTGSHILFRCLMIIQAIAY